MMLDKEVASPATRERLRKGPLTDLIEGFYLWLKDEQFSTVMIGLYLLNVSFLQEYLKDKYADGTIRLAPEDIEGFLRIRSANGTQRSICRFLSYLEKKDLYRPPVIVPHYQPILDGYTKWLRHYQRVSERSITLRIENTSLFLDWLGPEATTEGLASLGFRQLQDFCLSFARRRPGSTQNMSVTLRNFFRFCRREGYIKRDLTGAVPSVRHYRLDRVPCGFTEAEAHALLDSLDRQTPAGCRDYAMCLLLYTYGMRGGQLRALRLQDIHWERNEIFIKATKQGKDGLLPLTVEVGESLLDYIRDVRPRGTGHTEVFQTVRAPYRPLTRATLSALICRHAKAAGIDASRHGSHACDPGAPLLGLPDAERQNHGWAEASCQSKAQMRTEADSCMARIQSRHSHASTRAQEGPNRA
jgi:integrase